ncbi:class I SAM-dependent methyltransferase [Streptomyces asoensis]|uniref:class I SAM-dependent methyltransferase n=1 Tax=Streptomyces asoensis TaxID=249586 RepID=UPI0036B440FE
MPELVGPTCVLCGRIDRERLHDLPYGVIMRCRGCNLVSMLDEKTNHFPSCAYDQTYYRKKPGHQAGYKDYFGEELPERRKLAEVFAEALVAPPSTIERSLDVGCGGGYLVEALQLLGVRAFGVDGSEYAIGRAAHRTENGRFICGDLRSPEVVENGPYDVITMMDFLEHVENPVAEISAACSLLAANGRLVVMTPHYGRRLSKAQGRDYVQFKPDHLYHFDEDTLVRVMEKAGPGTVAVSEVIPWVESRGAHPPHEFLHKYSQERENVLAVYTAPHDDTA